MAVKRKICLAMIMVMLLSLVACTNGEKKISGDDNKSTDTTVNQEETKEDVTEEKYDETGEIKKETDPGETTTEEKTEEAIEVTTESDEDINARMVAYNEAIRAFIEEGRIPPFEEEYFEEPSEMNQYAVCDVNSDGRDELLIRVNDGAMASLAIYVFLYENDELRQIGTFFSDDDTTFYDNKVVISPLSHGAAGWGENFWGSDICIYNEELGEYEYKYVTDAWDSSVEDVWHGEDEVFPIEADKDGNGMVYYVIEYLNDEYVESEPMDDEAYNSWLDEEVGKAQRIDIPWEYAIK
ncbi:MAG: hypothetical protein IJ141_10530 [Lachnospiraceae bacterium]|nr:hypothetical protein [Lachnospiraceae bacterium]